MEGIIVTSIQKRYNFQYLPNTQDTKIEFCEYFLSLWTWGIQGYM
jgi:hypothetical protein